MAVSKDYYTFVAEILQRSTITVFFCDKRGKRMNISELLPKDEI